MKKFLLVVFATLLTSALALAQAGGTEQTVLDLEHQWIKAITASNGKALEPLLADTLHFYASDGSVQSKAQVIADTNKIKWQVNNFTDEKVYVHGDTAVVTGIVKGKGTDKNGKPFEANERYVDTWSKMPNGKWQCVASAGIPLK